MGAPTSRSVDPTHLPCLIVWIASTSTRPLGPGHRLCVPVSDPWRVLSTRSPFLRACLHRQAPWPAAQGSWSRRPYVTYSRAPDAVDTCLQSRHIDKFARSGRSSPLMFGSRAGCAWESCAAHPTIVGGCVSQWAGPVCDRTGLRERGVARAEDGRPCLIHGPGCWAGGRFTGHVSCDWKVDTRSVTMVPYHWPSFEESCGRPCCTRSPPPVLNPGNHPRMLWNVVCSAIDPHLPYRGPDPSWSRGATADPMILPSSACRYSMDASGKKGGMPLK